MWPLHCHIGWHLAVGKLAAIVVQPTAIRNMKIPASATAVSCFVVKSLEHSTVFLITADLAALRIV